MGMLGLWEAGGRRRNWGSRGGYFLCHFSFKRVRSYSSMAILAPKLQKRVTSFRASFNIPVKNNREDSIKSKSGANKWQLIDIKQINFITIFRWMQTATLPANLGSGARAGVGPIHGAQGGQFLNVPGVSPQRAGLLSSLGQPRPISGQSPLRNLPTQYVTTTSQVGRSASPVGRPVIVPQQAGQRVIQGATLSPQISGQAMPPKPTSSSRIEYVPFDKKVVDYETRQIVSSMWVPVQRKCLNYYAIEHITEYLPRQVDDVRYEMVPEESLHYRLQYVPVQKKIVHLPNEGYAEGYGQGYAGVAYGQGMGVQGYGVNQQLVAGLPQGIYGRQQQMGTSALSVPGYQQLENRGPLPKSNFVTSDGYVPSYLTPNVYQSQPAGSPSFLNNQQFISGITSAMKNQTQPQTSASYLNSSPPQPSGTPHFMNNPDFMSGLVSGFRSSTQQPPTQSQPPQSQAYHFQHDFINHLKPNVNRLSSDSYQSGRQTFTDRYAY